MERKKGYILQMVRDRGYGFIMGEDGTKYFFHASGVLDPEYDELKEGMQVNFIETDSPKGAKAIGIEKVEEAV